MKVILKEFSTTQKMDTINQKLKASKTSELIKLFKSKKPYLIINYRSGFINIICLDIFGKFERLKSDKNLYSNNVFLKAILKREFLERIKKGKLSKEEINTILN